MRIDPYTCNIRFTAHGIPAIIGNYMKRDIAEFLSLHSLRIEPRSTIGEALSLFRENPVNGLAVMEPETGLCLGILEKDAIIEAFASGASLRTEISAIHPAAVPFFSSESLPDLSLFFSVRFAVITGASPAEFVGVFESGRFLSSLSPLLSLLLERKVETNLSFEKNGDSETPFKGLLRKVSSSLTVSRELTDIIKYSSDSIYVTDGAGNTLFVNKAFEQISGIAGEDVLGKNVKDLEEQAAFTPSVTSLVLKEKRKITVVQELKNGRIVIATGVPIFDNQGAIFRVISNSKDLRELAALDRYLDELLANQDGYRDRVVTSPPSIICESEAMKQILSLAATVSGVDTTILLTGESGSGKGIIARLIHDSSHREGNRFIQINCGAIPELLLESELFGYEGGAFTGANRTGKPGLFEAADRGTLFLDEIGELPLSLQVKLLHAIQSKQITRVGGVEPITIDVRIISATNRDLEQLVREKKFRLDLYYRLHVIPIHVPSLRERREDIIPLTQLFMTRFNALYRKDVKLTADLFEQLLTYQWPGNIRELENLIERLVVTAENNRVSCGDITACLSQEMVASGDPIVVNRIIPLNQATDEVERILIQTVYSSCRNTYTTAEILGISQSSAQRKIQKYVTEK